MDETSRAFFEDYLAHLQKAQTVRRNKMVSPKDQKPIIKVQKGSSSRIALGQLIQREDICSNLYMKESSMSEESKKEPRKPSLILGGHSVAKSVCSRSPVRYRRLSTTVAEMSDDEETGTYACDHHFSEIMKIRASIACFVTAP
uniref:Uncharacterized protein n=1 Tax=Vespula pensylvanica TaxID=30213 RepID=A0A834UAA5_VESPE|nr:hypothetical protein H0235_007924 [Vespula pensylvanica]